MRLLDGRVFLSASDLMRFMGCAHATTLDLAYLKGEGPQPGDDSEDARFLQKRGDAHEEAHLQRLRDNGLSIIEIDRTDLAADAQNTREALTKGPDVVFQGAFHSERWGGWSDFLERVDKPSKLGNYSYEVVDTKLKRKPHPKHLLQLVLYSDLLSEVQGAMPEHAHIELGDGSRATFRLADYAAYARGARDRLEAFIADPPETRPIPCEDCAICRWAEHCESVWKDEDSLFTVANATRGQVKKLEAAGVRTMEQLAALDRPVPGIAEGTLRRLVTQAQLQHARKSGEPAWRYRDAEPGKGFDLLPKPQPGDLFYDIEGDPHYEGGLEYLHGVWTDDGKFHAFWAHDHDAEAHAISDLFDLFRDRLKRCPEARIYHYAPYEITALRRLTVKYGVGEAFFDRLLREQRFVDLYAVVRGGIIASEENYSIKSMEAFYGLKREGEVKTSGGSVVAYETWRETGEQAILDEIWEYNKDDCVSTMQLRDWFVSIRPDRPWPDLGEPAAEQEAEEDAATEEFRKELAASGLPPEKQEMLFNLGLFHQRERKPAQWAVFDSVSKDEDELIDSLDALGGLEADGESEQVKRSLVRAYRFPPQETKLRTGSSATVPVEEGPPASVSIEELDPASRRVRVKVGLKRAELLADRLSLHPDWPINTGVIADAIRAVIEDQCGPVEFTAAKDLLDRAPPRLTGGPHSDILGDLDPVDGVVAAVNAMQGTVLPIQGPPGSGKTYVTVRAILSLAKAGHRVGVASNSHEAVRNVLTGCSKVVVDGGGSEGIEIAHKVSPGGDGYPDDFDGVTRATKNDDDVLSSAAIVGGTAFFFARDENQQAFDWLFVDEAGQVSLANMIAMTRAAGNIVLVGDPRQLPQVIQGVQPHPADLSCLEWMLGEHATIPPDRGIFLPITRRMHPNVCGFISEQVYEGRLGSHPDTANQQVRDTSLPACGAYWTPVEHEGNSQISSEEVGAIAATIAELLKGTWTDKEGAKRPLTESDIIVVAPYNAQVNALREKLPPGVRVGTVDKFQGQEAPVCLVSMTASSAEDVPRGMEFLYALNRLNVAVSRAKGLALVFGSPRLREAKCQTVEQMKMVNTLCALPSMGGLLLG